jgi:hypothetical protein
MTSDLSELVLRIRHDTGTPNAVGRLSAGVIIHRFLLVTVIAVVKATAGHLTCGCEVRLRHSGRSALGLKERDEFDDLPRESMISRNCLAT